jgi:hypothetical protein
MAQPLKKAEPDTRSYVERIRDLVEFDYIEGARRLLAEAIQQGDENEELLRWKRILGPAKFRGPSDELELDRTPEFEWLRANGHYYQGQWVALAEGRLLAHSENLREVEPALETMTPSRRPLLHYVQPTLVTPAPPKALRKLNPDTRSYAERIRELVEHDYVGGARKLLAEALEKGDRSEDLLGWQRVLAPAKTVRIGGPRDIDRTSDVEWMRRNWNDYRGQWVALLRGELLAHSESLDEVFSVLKKNKYDHPPLLQYLY